MEAQTARGVQFDTGGVVKKARLMVPLCVPLLVSSVRKTNSAAIAAEVRGFNLRTSASGYKDYPLTSRDAARFAGVRASGGRRRGAGGAGLGACEPLGEADDAVRLGEAGAQVEGQALVVVKFAVACELGAAASRRPPLACGQQRAPASASALRLVDVDALEVSDGACARALHVVAAQLALGEPRSAIRRRRIAGRWPRRGRRSVRRSRASDPRGRARATGARRGTRRLRGRTAQLRVSWGSLSTVRARWVHGSRSAFYPQPRFDGQRSVPARRLLNPL